MTTLSQELAKQQRWKLKPQFANLRTFDALLENEFRPVAELEALQSGGLRRIVRFAAVHTPYYATLFPRLGLSADGIDSPDDLAKLPILRKQDVIQFQAELTSRQLPRGHKMSNPTKSSGTTGQPVSVLHTEQDNAMFGILRQRSSRWFGLDPAGTRVHVRSRNNRVRQTAKSDDALVRLPGWHYLDWFFHTGPEVTFDTAIPMEKQVAWLQELRPHYATTLPGVFAEWLFAGGGHIPVDSLQVLIGVGAQMTPSLRLYLEQNYRIPVHQAYGLNEIGAVAVRCDAGRYHINIEHCLVEIVSEDGRACAPGETGHLLVTGLLNPAMPLIRYDTGDLAEVVSGPCPCGRTLPAFGEIAGRHRNYAGLPSGTRERVRAIRGAIEKYPVDQVAFLRRYQIHQDRQNKFTLRLQIVAPAPDSFRQSVFAAWEAVAGTPPLPFTIVERDEIATPSHGKPLDFVSDFHSDSWPASQPQETAQPG